MPPPKKLDLIPDELRERLKATLEKRGFGDIVEVTEALNGWLEEEGLELTIGKTAVGNYSKLLKDQREAFGMAETLLADMDIGAESDMHRTLMQMIATSAMHMMQAVREEDGHLDAKSLMSLGRMLKDLMGSAGIREKLVADERARIAREAREAAQAEMAERFEAATAEAGLGEDTVAQMRRQFLGLRE